MGFRIWGLGFRVQGLGFSLGFRVLVALRLGLWACWHGFSTGLGEDVLPREVYDIRDPQHPCGGAGLQSLNIEGSGCFFGLEMFAQEA